MDLSDDFLMARVARGDSAAFETIYDRHAAIVLGVLLQVTGARARAEDILQETFWKVWQDAAAYSQQRGTFTSWILRIARSLAIQAQNAEQMAIAVTGTEKPS
jgi:RNA polymerase sigma-70 factor (ECF subfamily)